MILDLVEKARQYLHSHNRPPSQSFYDEMMNNKRKQEEKQAQQLQKQMEMLRRKEEKEVSSGLLLLCRVWVKLCTSYLKKKEDYIRTIFGVERKLILNRDLLVII